jgi:hypothetical protein
MTGRDFEDAVPRSEGAMGVTRPVRALGLGEQGVDGRAHRVGVHLR